MNVPIVQLPTAAISCFRRAMYSSVERGGVSRPSRNGWTTIMPAGFSWRARLMSL